MAVVAASLDLHFCVLILFQVRIGLNLDRLPLRARPLPLLRPTTFSPAFPLRVSSFGLPFFTEYGSRR